MTQEQTELWQRLERFVVDDPEASLPFTARLAKENGWTRLFALKVTEEYKRFVFLCQMADHSCAPPAKVGTAWRLHRLYVRSYWADFCGETLKGEVRSTPTSDGEKDSSSNPDLYRRTLAAYRFYFGFPPPAIWPSEDHYARETLQQESIKGEGSRPLGSRTASAAIGTWSPSAIFTLLKRTVTRTLWQRMGQAKRLIIGAPKRGWQPGNYFGGNFESAESPSELLGAHNHCHETGAGGHDGCGHL